jgi:hypothetical protein
MRGRKLVDVWVPDVWSYWVPDWQKSIQKAVARQVKERIEERLAVKLEFLIRENHHEFDVDNAIRTVFNILQTGFRDSPEKRPILNDYLIDDVEATKMRTEEEEKTHIQVWEWSIEKVSVKLKDEPSHEGNNC